MPLTAETIIQSLASGLLMGLLYGLIAVGLALIFGLMDVVNFAHGEMMMLAMYAAFVIWQATGLDPPLQLPIVRETPAGRCPGARDTAEDYPSGLCSSCFPACRSD